MSSRADHYLFYFPGDDDSYATMGLSELPDNMKGVRLGERREMLWYEDGLNYMTRCVYIGTKGRSKTLEKELSSGSRTVESLNLPEQGSSYLAADEDSDVEILPVEVSTPSRKEKTKASKTLDDHFKKTLDEEKDKKNKDEDRPSSSRRSRKEKEEKVDDKKAAGSSRRSGKTSKRDESVEEEKGKEEEERDRSSSSRRERSNKQQNEKSKPYLATGAAKEESVRRSPRKERSVSKASENRNDKKKEDDVVMDAGEDETKDKKGTLKKRPLEIEETEEPTERKRGRKEDDEEPVVERKKMKKKKADRIKYEVEKKDEKKEKTRNPPKKIALVPAPAQQEVPREDVPESPEGRAFVQYLRILERQKELAARASEATIRKIKAQEEERVAIMELKECNKQAEKAKLLVDQLNKADENEENMAEAAVEVIEEVREASKDSAIEVPQDSREPPAALVKKNALEEPQQPAIVNDNDDREAPQAKDDGLEKGLEGTEEPVVKGNDQVEGMEEDNKEADKKAAEDGSPKAGDINDEVAMLEKAEKEKRVGDEAADAAWEEAEHDELMPVEPKESDEIIIDEDANEVKMEETKQDEVQENIIIDISADEEVIEAKMDEKDREAQEEEIIIDMTADEEGDEEKMEEAKKDEELTDGDMQDQVDITKGNEDKNEENCDDLLDVTVLASDDEEAKEKDDSEEGNLMIVEESEDEEMKVVKTENNEENEEPTAKDNATGFTTAPSSPNKESDKSPAKVTPLAKGRASGFFGN